MENINKEDLDKVANFKNRYTATRGQLNKNKSEVQRIAESISNLSKELEAIREEEYNFFAELQEKHGDDYVKSLLEKLPEIFTR